METRYMVETSIEFDTISDSSDWPDLKDRIDSGEVVFIEVSARVINLISGQIGTDSLCGISTEAFAIESTGEEITAVKDGYIAECMDDCIDNAKRNAGVN